MSNVLRSLVGSHVGDRPTRVTALRAGRPRGVRRGPVRVTAGGFATSAVERRAVLGALTLGGLSAAGLLAMPPAAHAGLYPCFTDN